MINVSIKLELLSPNENLHARQRKEEENTKYTCYYVKMRFLDIRSLRYLLQIQSRPKVLTQNFLFIVF